MCTNKNNINFQIDEIFAGKLGYESVQQKNIRCWKQFQIDYLNFKNFPSFPFDLNLNF